MVQVGMVLFLVILGAIGPVAWAAEEAAAGAPGPMGGEAAAAAGQLMDLLGPTFARTHWWQWGVLLGAIFLGLAAGKAVQWLLRGLKARGEARGWSVRATVLGNAASPASLALFTVALMCGLGFVHMEGGLREFSGKIISFLLVVAVGWFLFNLIDVIDLWLRRLAESTDSKLDDLVVPLVRKTLRIFLVVVVTLFVAQNIFGLNITGWLAGLGIAGLAVSLAAQDSVKNLFGSLTIFFDKPFQIGSVIVFDGDTGKVEEIGFRSTRIRLVSGHVVTIPNMKFIDNKVENVTARPSIRREMNVTITYDTPAEKVEEAVKILRDILADPQVAGEGRFDLEKFPPRVAFNEFNADSLNIRAYYWYQLAGDPDRNWFTYLDHCQMVNMKLLRAYAAAGIDFAFPTQTLFVAADTKRPLAVRVAQG